MTSSRRQSGDSIGCRVGRRLPEGAESMDLTCDVLVVGADGGVAAALAATEATS